MPDNVPIAAPWSVPLRLDEVSEAGWRASLEADAATCKAIARAANVRAVDGLRATFEIRRRGAAGLHVEGLVIAEVEQVCVVSLEPMQTSVSETVDVSFAPPAIAEAPRGTDDPDGQMIADGPEPLVADGIDLGALAVEFLMLGIDPYPRKPDAVFTPPVAGSEDAGPFAALAALKKQS